MRCGRVQASCEKNVREARECQRVGGEEGKGSGIGDQGTRESGTGGRPDGVWGRGMGWHEAGLEGGEHGSGTVIQNGLRARKGCV